MVSKERIKSLWETSKKVILDCSLGNGAIIAANSDNPHYPKAAYNYRYVWPRDAGFICVAAQEAGLTTIQKPFFDWLLERPEGFKKTGLLYQNYSTNGAKYWTSFQPDQNGTMLWTICRFFKNKEMPKKYVDLVNKLANGTCTIWDKTHFTIKAQDLWEKYFCYQDLNENHVYSLAACVCGLNLANKITPHKRWTTVSEQMTKQIQKGYVKKHKHFTRTTGEIKFLKLDASLLGLVYPFNILAADDQRMINTVNVMERKIYNQTGLVRYEYDTFDGWAIEGGFRRRGSGSWPLLNFWLVIYYSKVGNKKKALDVYNMTLKQFDDYIPEQIFENNLQQSVKPLAWAHAMFILATKELDLI